VDTFVDLFRDVCLGCAGELSPTFDLAACRRSPRRLDVTAYQLLDLIFQSRDARRFHAPRIARRSPRLKPGAERLLA
jgi:hypothetical protein